jgi:hypothetical protein
VPDPLQKLSWLIQGYDGLTPIFKQRLSSALGAKEVGALLQRLAARDLSIFEVINSSLRKSMRAYSPALEVKREPRSRVILSCGQNPHYVAALCTEYEFRHDDLLEGF